MREKVLFEWKGKRYKYIRDGASVRYHCHNCCFRHPEGCMRHEVMNCLRGHWREVKEKEKE